jgi:hypothetical protein
MDQSSEKQQRIVRYRAEASHLYPELWSKIISDWSSPDQQDQVWLTYSANYLFRTNNVRWAIDPLTLDWRFEQASRVNAERDLKGLSFVLLTHDHNDHLDLDLLSALRDLPLTWIVPEPLLSKVILRAGLRRENIVVPSTLSPIDVHGLRILPFDGLHWETTPQGDLKGVPATGYLVECNGKRWLFPGDTRTYDASRLPAIASPDVVFAHLWLGRGAALQDEPPLLDAFCRFFLDLKPRKLILTHLYELGRDANDYWDQLHVQRVRSKFRELSVNFPISHNVMGESTQL